MGSQYRSEFKRFDSYSFIELDVVKGYFHYHCMTKLLEMNYNTEGFLLISDDVLIKYWNFDRYLDHKKIWFERPLIFKTELDPKIRVDCIWWGGEMGRKAMSRFVGYFENEKFLLNL